MIQSVEETNPVSTPERNSEDEKVIRNRQQVRRTQQFSDQLVLNFLSFMSSPQPKTLISSPKENEDGFLKSQETQKKVSINVSNIQEIDDFLKSLPTEKKEDLLEYLSSKIMNENNIIEFVTNENLTLLSLSKSTFPEFCKKHNLGAPTNNTSKPKLEDIDLHQWKKNLEKRIKNRTLQKSLLWTLFFLFFSFLTILLYLQIISLLFVIIFTISIVTVFFFFRNYRVEAITLPKEKIAPLCSLGTSLYFILERLRASENDKRRKIRKNKLKSEFLHQMNSFSETFVLDGDDESKEKDFEQIWRHMESKKQKDVLLHSHLCNYFRKKNGNEKNIVEVGTMIFLGYLTTLVFLNSSKKLVFRKDVVEEKLEELRLEKLFPRGFSKSFYSHFQISVEYIEDLVQPYGEETDYGLWDLEMNSSVFEKSCSQFVEDYFTIKR